jgi:hypothetical protein
VIVFTHEALAGIPEEMVRSPRVFGPALEAPQGADACAAHARRGRDR